MNMVLDRLTSPLGVDSFLSTFNPLWGAKLQGVIQSVEAVTADSASIRIRPGRSWKGHLAGQFVTVGVEIDGVRHHRCFSLTSVPDMRGGSIEISVHCAETGFVSRHLVHNARRGDVVQLTQADGQFTLQSTAGGGAGNGSSGAEAASSGAEAASKLLFVTGGSGITPVLGMIRTLATTKADRPDVVVMHHARTPEQMMFHSELSELADSTDWLEFHPTFTSHGGGHLDVGRLEMECPDWSDRQVYACGPASLIDFVQSHWAAADRSDAVHVERFTLGLAPRAATTGANPGAANPGGTNPGGTSGAGSTGTTTFGRSGIAVPSESDRPLLEVAEAAGLSPVSGCRMGICHTCTTLLEEGCVADLRDGRVSEAGSHVQICVSAAVEDVSLEL